MCRTIVQRHGGTINVASDGEDKGCAFTIELDLISAQSAMLSEEEEEKKDPSNCRRDAPRPRPVIRRASSSLLHHNRVQNIFEPIVQSSKRKFSQWGKSYHEFFDMSGHDSLSVKAVGSYDHSSTHDDHHNNTSTHSSHNHNRRKLSQARNLVSPENATAESQRGRRSITQLQPNTSSDNNVLSKPAITKCKSKESPTHPRSSMNQVTSVRSVVMAYPEEGVGINRSGSGPEEEMMKRGGSFVSLTNNERRVTLGGSRESSYHRVHGQSQHQLQQQRLYYGNYYEDGDESKMGWEAGRTRSVTASTVTLRSSAGSIPIPVSLIHTNAAVTTALRPSLTLDDLIRRDDAANDHTKKNNDEVKGADEVFETGHEIVSTATDPLPEHIIMSNVGPSTGTPNVLSLLATKGVSATSMPSSVVNVADSALEQKAIVNAQYVDKRTEEKGEEEKIEIHPTNEYDQNYVPPYKSSTTTKRSKHNPQNLPSYFVRELNTVLSNDSLATSSLLGEANHLMGRFLRYQSSSVFGGGSSSSPASEIDALSEYACTTSRRTSLLKLDAAVDENSFENGNNMYHSVLVVDDVAMCRKMCIRLIRNRFPVIDEATDGLMAVKKVTQSMLLGMPYDVVLLDYQMPVMDGAQAASEMRAKGYSGWIVGVTGNLFPADVETFLKRGANRVLGKPLDVSALDATLKGEWTCLRT